MARWRGVDLESPRDVYPPEHAAGRWTRLQRGLADPFVRNAYSLVGSTLASSALGFAFWLAAAWAYDRADYGRDATLIATMLFLSSLSQLNLTNGFNRFVPTAGLRARRLVLVGYLVAAGTAALTATVFVLGIELWAPRLSFVQDHLPYALWFVGGTVVWTLFALQDAVLTGLGEAQWVLVENVAYGIVKLVLLVTVAALLPVLGVFAAWTAPLAVAVVAVNLLIFRRLVPARAHPPLESVDAATVRHYVGFDLVGTWTMTATIGLLPLIVLAIVGPRGSAYLYTSWTIAYTLYLVSIGVGMSFVTESARAPERIVELARDMMAHALRIVAPLALLGALAAPLIWLVFPAGFGENATTLLRVLLLSAIPNVVTVTYLSIARVQRRMRAVIVATLCLAVGVVGLSVVLTHAIGVTGVGVAWLVSQSALALVLLLGELRTVWLPYVPIRRLRGRKASGAGFRPAQREPNALVATALESAGLTADGWVRSDAMLNTAGILVVAVRDRAGDPTVLKVAIDSFGAAALDHERAVLGELRAVAPPLVAAVLPGGRRGEAGAIVWSVEDRPPGRDARELVADPEARERVLADVVTRMRALYDATARPSGVDASELLGSAFAALDALPATRLRGAADAAKLAQLEHELSDQLRSGSPTVARVHGNLWVGNVVCAPGTSIVTRIVNWEWSDWDLPVVDVMHLLLTTRSQVEDRELGAVVRDLLGAGALDPSEAELLASVPGASELSVRSAVLLAWLRHVRRRVERGAGEVGSLWMTHNVHQVLESV
jgi:O-antigen/teichoic acid export membrane protein